MKMHAERKGNKNSNVRCS